MPENVWSRRDFLKLSGAAASAALIPACAHSMKGMEKDFEAMPTDNMWTPHAASAWVPKDDHADAYDILKKLWKQPPIFHGCRQGIPCL